MSHCDLHAHTNASDGTDTPAQLARGAALAGLSALALTDHDTTAGHDACREACGAVGVEFVPGVELSGDARGLLDSLGQDQPAQLHILGLFVGSESPELRSLCESLREGRDARVPRMLAALGALGMPVTLEEVRAAAAGAVLCRPHVAQALLDRAYVASRQEAFDRYIGLGGPAYVEKDDGAAAECIGAIHASGGVAVLAHPISLNCSGRVQLCAVLGRLRDLGLDGVEVLHSDQPAEFSRVVAELARELGLAPSGGSDYHGVVKPRRLGAMNVPVEFLEGLRARRPGMKEAPSTVPGA